MGEAKNTKNLFQRDGGIWYFLGYRNGERIRKSTGCTDLDAARGWVDANYPKPPRKGVSRIAPTPDNAQPFKVTKEFISNLYARMKARFPGSKIMSKADLVKMFDQTGGVCQITGIRFANYSAGDGKSRNPFMPSIDRIDSAKPYTIDNCRIVCLAVNLAMNEWGGGVFDAIVSARAKVMLDSSVGLRAPTE